MTSLFSDTSPDAEAVLIDLLREASPARKLEMVSQLNTTMRTLMLSGLRQRHPDADDAEVRRRMADLLLDPELATKAYGPFAAMPPETENSDE